MRPNILWICTDQHRFDALGCYDNEIVQTPNIDKLAKKGILFEKAYCQSPTCSPSRASFLTGRYPRTCRVRQNGQQIPEDEVLVTKLFSEAGYTVGLSGKLHISACHTDVCADMEKRIDDGYSHFSWSHHPDFLGAKSNWPLNGYNQWLLEEKKYYDRIPFENSKYIYQGMETDYSHSRWCANEAIKFINSFSAYKNNPWMFSLNFYDPHHDFDPPLRLLKKYLKKLTEKDLPKYRPGELKNKTTFQQSDHRGAYNIEDFFDWEAMEYDDHIQIKAAYYAMIEQIDEEVGRVITALKEASQYENTIIIFMSDHGEMLGDHGIYLKGPYFYEPLIKVPLIFSWPTKLAKGRRVTELVELVDLAPTLLEVAGIERYPYMQGKSFCSMMYEQQPIKAIRESVYASFDNAMARKDQAAYVSMVATKEYKLVYSHATCEGELYNLIEDPSELENLYDNKKYQVIKAQMLELMVNRMAFTVDPKPERIAFY